MRSIFMSLLLVLLPSAGWLGAQSNAGAAAPAQPPAATPQVAAAPLPDVLTVAKRLMAEAHYAFLITLGADGRAESRIVDPFPPEVDWTVWLATNPVTRKVGQIRANPHATLSYWDAGSMGYVTLIGDATLVDDPAEKAKHWKPEWKQFYADENRGADYLLIRFVPLRLELVSHADGLVNDPRTWRPIQHQFR